MSNGLLNSAELMLAQFCMSALPTMLSVFVNDVPSLRTILNFSASGWFSFFGLAWGVYLIANWLQIMVNRELGTIRHSAASGLRLIATCLGSALMLNESPTSKFELIGLCLVILGVAIFYTAQLYTAQSMGSQSLVKASTYSIGLDELCKDPKETVVQHQKMAWTRPRYVHVLPTAVRRA